MIAKLPLRGGRKFHFFSRSIFFAVFPSLGVDDGIPNVFSNIEQRVVRRETLAKSKENKG